MSWKPQNKRATSLSWMPEWLRLALRVFMRLAATSIVLLLLVSSYYYFKAQEFDISKVASTQPENALLDRNGKSLLSPPASGSNKITTSDLPPELVDALIAREDKHFESHCGVDFIGLMRATLRNAKDMSFTQGASTLTMQLARNTYDIRAKSLNRKFLEIALTLRIEQNYSKPEIMANYLNKIYFGSGCYGIEQAAQKYFQKSTKDLNLEESATLVGIIRGPHIFSPLNDIEAAEHQRNQVLDRMVAIDKIDQKVADKIKSQPLKLPKKKHRAKKAVATTSPFAMSSLERHMREILLSDATQAGGLTTTSSLDLKMLKQCEDDIARLLKSANKKDLQAACVIINHKTGGIRAIIGGADFTKNQFNIALDGKIDLGEIFTPFIYAAAIERGKLPIKGNPIQTGKQLDEEETQRIAYRFGFKTPFNLDGIYHGSGTTSPLELVTAFSAFSNKGKKPRTYFIENITKDDGSVLFSNDAKHTQCIQKGTAEETAKLLKKKGFTQYSAAAFRGRALWSLTSKNDLSAVLWLGYLKPRAIKDNASLLKKMQKITQNWVD